MSKGVKKGNTNFKGRKHTEETKKMFSEMRKNKNTGKDNPFFGNKHTEETKEKLRKRLYGNIPSNAIEIIIDNITYISIAEASRQLNISSPTILWRLKSKIQNLTTINTQVKICLRNHRNLYLFMMLIIVNFKIFHLIIINIFSNLFNGYCWERIWFSCNL